VGELWHDRSVIVFVRIILRLLADLVGLMALSVRPRRSLKAENLFLRRELALYQERGVKPRRVDAVTRVSLALLSPVRLARRPGRGPPRDIDPLASGRLAPVLALEGKTGTAADS